MLDSDNDVYMKAKCHESVWFTIELCEPALISEIQMVNYEPFSSSPKSFTISLSVTPDGVFTEVAQEFTLLDQHQLQTFRITDKDISTHFYKYVKFMIKEVYGSEHYCPISFVAVFGKNWLKAADQENVSEEVIEGEIDVGDKEVVGGEIGSEPEKEKAGEAGLLSKVKNFAMDKLKPAEKMAKELVEDPVVPKRPVTFINSSRSYVLEQGTTEVVCWSDIVLNRKTLSKCESARSLFKPIYDVPTATDAPKLSTTTEPIAPEKPQGLAMPKLPIMGMENYLMILNNRLSIFEANLNQTTAYLQELSSQYKQQMDGIRNVHNRTLSRLIAHIESSEEFRRENEVYKLKKDKQLDNLQKQIFFLKRALARVERRQYTASNMDDRHWQTIVSEYLMNHNLTQEMAKYDIDYNDVIAIFVSVQLVMTLLFQVLSFGVYQVLNAFRFFISLPWKIFQLSSRRQKKRQEKRKTSTLKKSTVLDLVVYDEIASSNEGSIDNEALQAILYRLETLEETLYRNTHRSVTRRNAPSFSKELSALRIFSQEHVKNNINTNQKKIGKVIEMVPLGSNSQSLSSNNEMNIINNSSDTKGKGTSNISNIFTSSNNDENFQIKLPEGRIEDGVIDVGSVAAGDCASSECSSGKKRKKKKKGKMGKG